MTISQPLDFPSAQAVRTITELAEAYNSTATHSVNSRGSDALEDDATSDISGIMEMTPLGEADQWRYWLELVRA